MKILFLQKLVAVSVLLLTGSLAGASDISSNISFHQSSEIFFDQDFNDDNDAQNTSAILSDENLPVALPQSGAQPRNYVAYIPVPISGDEGEEEEEKDDEYYYDEEEEDEDEYYENDYEEEEKKKKKPPKRKPPPRKRPTRRNRHSNRRKDEEKENDSERIPFLVPLMMVPESEIGVDKQFSFAGDQLKNSNLDLPANNNINRGPNFNSRPGNLNRFLNRPLRTRRPFFNNRLRRPFPADKRLGTSLGDVPPLHNQPGPPYPGPNPRAPNKPLDTTIIHPSIQHPVYRKPGNS